MEQIFEFSNFYEIWLGCPKYMKFSQFFSQNFGHTSKKFQKYVPYHSGTPGQNFRFLGSFLKKNLYLRDFERIMFLILTKKSPNFITTH